MSRPLHGSARCGCGQMIPGRPDPLDPATAGDDAAQEEAAYHHTPQPHDCPADWHGMSVAPRPGEEDAWRLASGLLAAT
jgi:hypothetical protein